MNPVTLNLSDELQQFVQGEATTGEFNGPADFIEALIVRAKAAKSRIDAKLTEGLESGEPIPLDKEEWARIRAEVRQRIANG